MPDFIKDSVAVYVGCIAGALMRDEYIGIIEATGFQQIGIVDETSVPVEWLANDPSIKASMEVLQISPEKIKEFDGSVVSMKISGVKPKEIV